MKTNFLRIIASMAILSILLLPAPIKAQPSAQPPESTFQNSKFSEKIDLPEGLADSEWQDIQTQILSNLTQQAYLKASNTNAADDFGWSVAISGDTLVVGAFREDSAATGVNGNQNDNSASDAGAAYVFVRSGTSWSQQAYLKASNTNAGDNFGNPVAIYGGTIVVSAPLEDSAATGINGNQSDNSASGAGAVYVFGRSGTTWSQQAYLKASNTNAEDYFGDTIAVSQDTIVVGAPGEDSAATGVNGNQGDNSASYAGAAYVFVRSGTSWSQQAYLKASNTNAYDDFGFPVSISGDTIVVGAPLEDSAATGVNGNQGDNSASSSGAAYVFVRSSSSWSQQAYLKASNTNAGDYFGNSLSISNDTIAIGAPREDSSSTGVNGNQNDNSANWAGAAYVFVRSSTIWSQQAYLKASNTQADDYFGEAVGISGDTIVIGALYEDSSATGVNGNQGDNSAIDAGAAYVFVRSGTSWSQDAYLKASNTNAGDGFSDSVALSGDTILIGAPYEDSAATGVNGNQNDNSADGAGAAYVIVGEPSTPPIDPSWLLMYYFAGDNDLDEHLDYEFYTVRSNLQPYVDIAVFQDSESKGTTYWYFPSGGSEVKNLMGNLNSGDGQTLSDFVSWAKQLSSAPHTALIIADHGHGLTGVAWDYRSGKDKILVDDELRDAMIASGPVDVLYTAACLTANLEFMWELRDYTDYYVASESQAIAPITQTYVFHIGENTSARDLAVSMAESYYNQFGENEDKPSTISVTNMAYIYDMFVKTNDLALAIKNAPLDVKLSLWYLLDASILQRFDEDNPIDGICNSDRFGDLFHFASLVDYYSELSPYAQALLNLEGQFVVYDKAWSGSPVEGVEWQHYNARGVSIALPRDPISFYDGEWIEFANGADWSFANPGIQSVTTVDGFNWGPMVSDLIFINNPQGEDDPLPPDPLPLLIQYNFYIPLILR